MMRHPSSRGIIRSGYKGRLAPQAAGWPRFNRQRPIGNYARRLPRAKPRARVQFHSDGFFGFALVGSTLLAEIIGTPGAAAVSIVAVLYVALRLPQFSEIMAPRALILIIPAFAVLSILWSQSPADTLKYSLEFALTVVVALVLSASPHPKSVLWGVFLAIAIYVASAMAFGQTVAVGNNGETAFSGLSQSKNLLADVAAMGALVSLACFVASIEDRRLFRAIVACAAAAMEVYLLLKAHSAGAVLGMAPAVLAFVFFLALRPARLAVRLIATLFISLAGALVTIGYGSTFIQDSMALFDKDPTLTGRTYLWNRAADFIAENPVLGTGYNGFWLQGNPDAEGLWLYFKITDRTGFSFHNTLIELLVNLGWVGVFVLGAVAIISAVLLLNRAMARPTLTVCFWLSLLIYGFVRMPIEAIGMAPFSHTTLLLFAAFGVALPARRTAEARKASRRIARYRTQLFRPAFQDTLLRPSRLSP
jgi:exopolysaccharide production protein ExoQ